MQIKTNNIKKKSIKKLLQRYMDKNQAMFKLIKKKNSIQQDQQNNKKVIFK